MLWWWCMDYAKDGQLDKYGPKIIADACAWRGDAELFLDALIDAGFVDRGPLRIHDWPEYRLHYDLLMEKRERNLDLVRERVKRYRERNADAKALHQRNVTQSNAPTIPDLTNQTIPTVPIPEFDFKAIWNAYPKRIGEKKSLEYFKASVKADSDYADIRRALANYKNSREVRDGFVKDAHRWFRSWREWVDYQEPTKSTVSGAPSWM